MHFTCMCSDRRFPFSLFCHPHSPGSMGVAQFRSRLSAMPYIYQHWWAMYPAVFSFPSFIKFGHHIFPSPVVSCNFLSDEMGPREPKNHCLQQTKGSPARSRCFQVACLLKMISFGCPLTGDNRTWQCKV